MSTAAPTAVLKQFLEQRQVAGQSHVLLRPGMLDRLHHGRQVRAERVREVRQRVANEPPPTMVAAIVREASVASPEPAPPQAKASHSLCVAGTSKVEKLAALAALAEAAPEARALGTLRDTMVFAVGSPDASIMFIGEAPGAEEERQREPFVGPAGQKLTGIITAMGLRREDVYISNICKFRPAMENQGSGNRAPAPAEMQACLPFVYTEIEILQPQIIVALGGTAAAGLGLEGPVSKLRGRIHQVRGLPVIVTYHPSYLLREEKLAGGGLRAKREVWEDMLQVMERAGLAISEKQRNYFKK